MKTVTAADANRHFSNVLREVAQGEAFTVLSRGKPVATIAPVTAQGEPQRRAKEALLARLRTQTPSGVRNWTRDELYES